MMQNKPNILVLGDQPYTRPFIPHGNIRRTYHDRDAVELAEVADIVVFCGGTDVGTSLYHQKPGSYTGIPDVDRDDIESQVFDVAFRRGIPMAGICRGAQFGCVMNGGKLYQHVSGHGMSGAHGALTSEKEEIRITSTHHQMLDVRGTRHELLAWASPNLSETYLGENDMPQEPPEREPEVVWFPATKFLAAQYHPEYMQSDSSGWKYYQRLLTSLIFNNR